ncbi:MAG: hypothetical protein ACJ754_13070 [Pyrinomonadaceae bacterium]
MPKNLNGYGWKSLTKLSCALLTVGLALFADCARPSQPVEGAATMTPTPPQAQATTTAPDQTKSGDATATQPTAARPATLADAQTVVAHIYRDAVVVETGRGTPFVVGDFNGDGSEDIAVVVKPAAGKLTTVNSKYSNWIVEDPRKVLPPEIKGDAKVFPNRPEPVIVRQGDSLLAVIHGYGKDGWRDPLTSQTYLLKNAPAGEMKMQSAEDAFGAAADKGRLPQMRGDVIRETLAGEAGFIYWTGAKYAWSGPARD